MPVYDVEIRGEKFRIDAPDDAAAASAAKNMGQHPWIRAMSASKGYVPEATGEFSALSGTPFKKTQEQTPRLPIEGQMWPDPAPGGSYMPTKGENAEELGRLGATIAAGPLAGSLAPAYPILAPALGRTVASAAPDVLTGNFEQGFKRAAATAGMETLMTALGLPGRAFSAWRQRGMPQPAVHQAANFQSPVTIYGPTGAPVSQVTPPITFNRVNPGAGPAPTVHGGGPTTVTPNQVIVRPPTTGTPITGGPSPAAILQEPLTRSAGGFEVGQAGRTAADVYAGENPDTTLGALALIFDKVKGLNPFRSENAASMAGR